jgi:nucleoside 2-deoxyribosyltransferase
MSFRVLPTQPRPRRLLTSTPHRVLSLIAFHEGACMLVYLAAPLFSQGERRWNRDLARALAERARGIEVTLPQDFRVKGRYNDRKRFEALFEGCLSAIAKSDAVLAVLDGADVDSGVAFEMGYAHALKIPVVGVRTDFRQSQERGVNLMCSRPCGEYVCRMSFGESIEGLADEIARKLVSATGARPARRAPLIPS